MAMRAKNPVDSVPERSFTADELEYASKRGITRGDLQRVHAQAVVDGHGNVPFIRLLVCARGGVPVLRGGSDG